MSIARFNAQFRENELVVINHTTVYLSNETNFKFKRADQENSSAKLSAFAARAPTDRFG